MPLIPWQAQDTNHLPGKPVPALTTLRVKKCFPMHSLILPWQCCAILTCPAMGSRSTARCLSVSPPQGIAGSTEITSSNWTAQVPSAPPRRTCLPALLPALLPSLDAFKGLNILFFFFCVVETGGAHGIQDEAAPILNVMRVSTGSGRIQVWICFVFVQLPVTA